MSSWWILSHVALWGFAMFLALLILGLYRQVGELRLSPGRRLSLAQGIEVGNDAPSFALVDSKGYEFRQPPLSDPVNDTPTVIIFGSAGCPPCASLADELASMSSDAIRFAFIGGPDSEENRDFAQAHPLSFPVLTDPERAVSTSYKVDSTPFVFVLDPKGVVRAKGITSTSAGVRGLMNDSLGKRGLPQLWLTPNL